MRWRCRYRMWGGRSHADNFVLLIQWSDMEPSIILYIFMLYYSYYALSQYLVIVLVLETLESLFTFRTVCRRPAWFKLCRLFVPTSI